MVFVGICKWVQAYKWWTWVSEIGAAHSLNKQMIALLVTYIINLNIIINLNVIMTANYTNNHAVLTWPGDEFCNSLSLERSTSLDKLDLDSNSGCPIVGMKWSWVHVSCNWYDQKTFSNINILQQSMMMDKDTADALNPI